MTGPADSPPPGEPVRELPVISEGRERPIARVAVDIGPAHLDRLFDYAVPPEAARLAVPGARVKVRFAGRQVAGVVLERVATSDHPGRLTVLSPVSGESVLAPEVTTLARTVADRMAGSLFDVLRLALPPRVAGVEKVPAIRRLHGPLPAPDGEGLADHPGGAAFLQRLADGGSPRAVWTAAPGRDPFAVVAAAVSATLASGRGALVVVPDARDLARLDAALTGALGVGRHAQLSADSGPTPRYRAFLAVRRGDVAAVAGTRAAIWAPVRDLGLVVVWDDGDDLHHEPRAPYPHVREVAVARAHQQGAGLLLGGFARTPEAQLLVDTGWARALEIDPVRLRRIVPAVAATGDAWEQERDPGAVAARLPGLALRAAREALASDHPVLVQVPRRGYVPSLACGRCRAPARCPHCGGPLALTGAPGAPRPADQPGALGAPGAADQPGAPGAADEPRPPSCAWCGRPDAGHRCSRCGSPSLRATVTGARRTAEELGRAFPGVAVHTSGGNQVLDEVPAGPALVVATPGAEPVASGGYGTVLLLDAWALLGRPSLQAGQETLRRWLSAAALARPGVDGGRVVVVADAGVAAVQALVRWAPEWAARRELNERTEVGFPPAVRMAAVTGTAAAVADLLARAELPPHAVVLGPVPVQVGADEVPRERALVRVPRGDGAALAAGLRLGQAVRAARREGDPVQVRLDPTDWL